MKNVESALGACVLGLACFIGGQTLGLRRAMHRQESAGAIADRVLTERVSNTATQTALDTTESFGTAEPEMHVTTSLYTALPLMSAFEMKRRLMQSSNDNYISDVIVARDSTVVRWPDRLMRPLRVWVDERNTLAGWNSDFVPAVRDAFSTWVETGVPVHFDFIHDSASADIHVRFTERFANGISGKTVWSRDNAWWLVSSDIQIGLAHPGGGTVTPPQMRAIALHEVGHLLGLDHSHALDNIMSARIRVRDLTDEDRATIRLLYSVPAGSLR